jgi:alpha/beta superfamily hydrolase
MSYLKEFLISNVTLFVLIVLIGNGYAMNSSSKNLFSIHYDISIPHDNIALIIPGRNQKNSDPGYDSVGAYYKSKGISPVYVNIDWKVVGIGKLSDAAFQIDSMLKDSFPDSHVFLFGFSFGAVISLKLSQLICAEQIILCSMSPLFSEDRFYQIFPFKQLMGIVTDYSSNGLSYSSSLGTCVYFLYGDHDNFVINKAIIKNRKTSFKCNETRIVANTGHNISSHSYLKAIKQIVQKISQ